MRGVHTIRGGSSHRKQERRARKIQRRTKWFAVALSALLLVTTLLLVRMQRAPAPNGYVLPATESKTSLRVR